MPVPRRLAGSLLVYGLSEAFSRGIAFAVFPILTHLFTSGDFGRISLLASLGAFAGLLANFGLTNAAHRFYLDSSVKAGGQGAVISTGFILLLLLSLSVVISSVVFLLAIPDRYLGEDLVDLALIVLITVVPAQLLQYSQDVIRLHATPWRYFFLAVAKSLLGLIFGLLLVVGLDLGIWGYFVGLLCGQLILVPWGMLMIRHELSTQLDRMVGAKMLKYGYPFIFAGLGQWVISSADLFILGQIRGITEVGIYSAALRVATVVMLVTTAFSLVWGPNALRLHAVHPEYRRIVGDMLPRVGSLLIYVAALVSFFGKELITWLTPPEYHSATVPLCFLCMSTVVAGSVQITALGLAFECRSDLIAKTVWASALVGVCMSYLLTWQWGLVGTAVANMLTALLLTSGYLYLTQRIHPLMFKYELIGRMLLLGMLVLGIAILWAQAEISPLGFVAKIISLLGVLVTGHRLGFPLPYSSLRDLVVLMRRRLLGWQ